MWFGYVTACRGGGSCFETDRQQLQTKESPAICWLVGKGEDKIDSKQDEGRLEKSKLGIRQAQLRWVGLPAKCSNCTQRTRFARVEGPRVFVVRPCRSRMSAVPVPCWAMVGRLRLDGRCQGCRDRPLLTCVIVSTWAPNRDRGRFCRGLPQEKKRKSDEEDLTRRRSTAWLLGSETLASRRVCCLQMTLFHSTRADRRYTEMRYSSFEDCVESTDCWLMERLCPVSGQPNQLSWLFLLASPLLLADPRGPRSGCGRQRVNGIFFSCRSFVDIGSIIQNIVQ